MAVVIGPCTTTSETLLGSSCPSGSSQTTVGEVSSIVSITVHVTVYRLPAFIRPVSSTVTSKAVGRE